MLNNSGITSISYGAPKQILANVAMQASVGCVVAQDVGVDVGTKKIAKAGTPIAGSLSALTTPFTSAVDSGAGTLGVYNVQIKTAATAGDIITIENIDYTCGAEESVEGKVFIGSTAAEQVTSLLKMVLCNDFVVAADTAADKIKFTQKVAATGNEPAVVATKGGSGTIVIGNVATVTPAVEGAVVNNAVGVLLHDVDVTAGNANATLLLFGFVNVNMLESSVQALITQTVKDALKAKVTFLAV